MLSPSESDKLMSELEDYSSWRWKNESGKSENYKRVRDILRELLHDKNPDALHQSEKILNWLTQLAKKFKEQGHNDASKEIMFLVAEMSKLKDPRELPNKEALDLANYIMSQDHVYIHGFSLPMGVSLGALSYPSNDYWKHIMSNAADWQGKTKEDWVTFKAQKIASVLNSYLSKGIFGFLNMIIIRNNLLTPEEIFEAEETIEGPLMTIFPIFVVRCKETAKFLAEFGLSSFLKNRNQDRIRLTPVFEKKYGSNPALVRKILKSISFVIHEQNLKIDDNGYLNDSSAGSYYKAYVSTDKLERHFSAQGVPKFQDSDGAWSGTWVAIIDPKWADSRCRQVDVDNDRDYLMQSVPARAILGFLCTEQMNDSDKLEPNYSDRLERVAKLLIRQVPIFQGLNFGMADLLYPSISEKK
ncbi:hypothetical protein JW756_02005 [Candidatus Woesearchaeota archaeon]|nr:hypothetical protein [Candidatus Woesearchaeota archaeon]